MNPKDLPVYQQKQKIIDSLAMHQAVVIESPTGSGKTTQLPLILHEAGYTRRGKVGVTQPRRIAAVSVSDYIASQIGETIPGTVGYKMRFEDNTLPSTTLKIMTDGTLLQEMKTDPLLKEYSVLMVDEAHERSLNIDFILGLLKTILEERHDFKVIISSATINASVFSEYFNGCPIISIDTPVYPVQIIYDPPPPRERFDEMDEEMIKRIGQVIGRIMHEEREGDILIFMTGEKTIKDCISYLSTAPYARDLHIVPLYGRLGKEEQEKVFDQAPPGKTKVVISTNIAETSVTINGITTVIDTGLCKINYYNPSTFTSSLNVRKVSQASSNQRKGRAGRTQPGSCYRLFEKEDFGKRPLFTLEEIYRTDLAEVVLRMADLGIRDFYSFDFISPPERRDIVGAVETLKLLDALDNEDKLTDLGKQMVIFPLMPRHARIILEGVYHYPEVLREVLITTSFLSTNAPFLLPQGEEMEARKAHHTFRDNSGDFGTYLNLFRKFVSSGNKESFCHKYYLDLKIMNEIVNIEGQLEDIVGEMGVPVLEGGPMEDFICCCARGLIQFVCTNTGRGTFRSLTADKIGIHPGSVMFRENPPYIVAGEIVKTSRTFARSVSPLKKEWLKKISPQLAESFGAIKTKGRKNQTRQQTIEQPGRDTSWQVSIGGVTFPVKQQKGKRKTAELDYEKLKEVLRTLKGSELPDYRNMKGNLYYKGNQLYREVRVNTLLKMAEQFNPSRDILTGYNRKTFNIENEHHQKDLAEEMENLMKIFIGGKRKKHSSGGFIALGTDSEGTYWLRAERSFTKAVSGTLETLEILADEVSESLDDSYWQKINKAYRRLDEYFSW